MTYTKPSVAVIAAALDIVQNSSKIFVVVDGDNQSCSAYEVDE